MKSSHLYHYLTQGIQTLQEEDPILFELLEKEHQRQCESLSLVASSGGTDSSVMAVSASSIVNVTAEGYPGKRYHAGCFYVDQIESLAIERAKKIFGAHYVNVQPHCASFANHIVMQSLLNPGDTILGMALDQGGHLTHGAPVNLSGKLFNVHSYGLNSNSLIDYDQMRTLAQTHQPKLIVCGTTSYTRIIDFERIRRIADEVGAYVLADITHIAGLVAAGLHPSPIHSAHFTTTCTFKQLYGPRGGLIMMGKDANTLGKEGHKTLSQQIQSTVFPMVQGSPEVQTIAAKVRGLGRLLHKDFQYLAQRIRRNANTLASSLIEKGYDVIGGGTDNHIVLFRTPENLNGTIAEKALEACQILVNKNKIPGDTRAASIATGVRLGSNTVSLRGMDSTEMLVCVDLIDRVLRHTRPLQDGGFELSPILREETIQSVHRLCQAFPMPYQERQHIPNEDYELSPA